jgi:hypothetical protein
VAKLTPGHLPHMPNGTAFYSRAEMEAVGFHSKQMNGIDYCSAKNSRYLAPVGNAPPPPPPAGILDPCPGPGHQSTIPKH